MSNIIINGMRESTFGDILNNYAPDELRNPLFANLRVFIDANNNFWFIGSEVASIMGYENTRDAVLRHVPDNYKQTITRNGGLTVVNPDGQKGGFQSLVIIYELGIYALAMRSRLPQAYEFQDWVYRVISRIRQYGGYINPNLKQIVDVIPEQYRQHFSNMIEEKNRIIENQQMMINDMMPKVEFYDRVMDSSNVVPMTVIAKDFGMSANELHTLLAKLQVIYRVMDTWVLHKPYQNRGLTATKSLVTLTDQFGNIHYDVEIATYWTEKGRLMIYGILAANNHFPLAER